MTRSHSPGVLPGSLVTLRRKCGKAGCRCVSREPHESPALSCGVEGRTKLSTLSPEEVGEVFLAVARYRKAVTELGIGARGGLDELVARVQARRAAARR